ncbi:hypothetical protein WA026_018873 [Henosepilachna vigintioctopunctata]|uniref:Probable RNA-binding protein EIF1AD n=1 Tax=Henosepilachna vigintioctopunctata TaxID=420089 RepID=A0AAW1UMH6_9CUCU
MSRATKRKHVMREISKDDFSPPKENQQIGQQSSPSGGPDNSTFLVSLPNKFRRNIWIKRGNFVIIDPIVEGVKVKGEIVKILSDEHIKYYKKDNAWPQAFTKEERKGNNEIEENLNWPHTWDNGSDDSNDSSNCSDDSYSKGREL